MKKYMMMAGVVLLTVGLTACSGKKSEAQASDTEVTTSEPDSTSLSDPSDITDIEGCPFDESAALGYWRRGLGDSLVFVIYEKNRQYYDVVYNISTRQFHESHPLMKGNAKGLTLYKCASENCFYEIQDSVGKLAIRSLSDTEFIEDYYWPVHFEKKKVEVQAFTLNGGKLGPIEIGKDYTTIPASVAGLYDKYERKSETHEDMDGEWTEEFLQFYKESKKVFTTGIEGKKITSFNLTQHSGYIQTAEGIHVGYNARELFQKKAMEWGTYYEGEAFASKDGYTYYVSSDELTTDVPSKAADFKPTATVTRIVYVK